MMDIALSVESLFPGAQYTGSVTGNREADWNAVTWSDTRDGKPTWAELQTAWNAVSTTEERRVIRTEAERRIAAGLVLTSGVRFRCDDQSIARLTGMTNSTVWPKTFKTHAGVTVTLDTQAQAQAVFAECDTYITAVLAASSTLQDTPPVDPAADVHWPGDGSI